MQLYPINTGNFKLDGGAVFGVVPKSIWQKSCPADHNNMINLTMRCLLIEHGKRLILIDTGIGNKQSAKFFGYYYLWGDVNLDISLQQYGFHRDDITDVLLTHLHFDHCGGAIEYSKQQILQPAFKNARFWSNQSHWQWATQPNAREKASFLAENILPIQQSGQLQFIDLPTDNNIVKQHPLGFDILMVDGHTEKMMVPLIPYQQKTIAFVADLIPTVSHLPLPYIASYDTRPLLAIDEKQKFLQMAVERNYYLFFQHDIKHELCTVKSTDKGVRLQHILRCQDVF